jgi:hypothetical protein
MWLLTIEDDEGLTTYHRLSGERCTFGRSPDNDVVLAQLNVSRRHARLERRAGVLFVVDEGSRIGSFVNGRRASKPTPIADGDSLQIGDYLVWFSRELAAADYTPPPHYVLPARLRALAGPLAGFEHLFGRDETVTIGSWDDCTVRLVDGRVRPLHAVIRTLPGGRHELVDESGRGLLSVNDRPIFIAQALEGGDAINVAGVALFRYLEPRQMPDPRFDQFWGEGSAPPSADAPPLSRYPIELEAAERAPRGAEAGAPRASGDGGAIDLSDDIDVTLEPLAPPPERVEVVRPTPLTPQPAPSASYWRLRQTTIGRGADSKGPQRAVVVERAAASGESDAPPKPRTLLPSLHSPLANAIESALPCDEPPAASPPPAGPAPSAAAPARAAAPAPGAAEAMADPSPSGHLPTAFEAPVAPEPDAASASALAPGARPGGTPGADGAAGAGRKARPRRGPAFASAGGIALTTFGVGVLGTSLGMGLLRPADVARPEPPPPAAGPVATLPRGAGTVVTPAVATFSSIAPVRGLESVPAPDALPGLANVAEQPPSPAAARGLGLAARGARPGRAAPPAGPADGTPAARRPHNAPDDDPADHAAAPPEAGPSQGGRRARLEARARAGRASHDELRELLSLCQAAGDVPCVVLSSQLLRSAPDESAPDAG